MLLTHVLYVSKPVVRETDRQILLRRLYAATSVVPTDNDVLDLEHVDGVLQYGKAVQVRMDDDVRDVAVNEQLTWQQANNLVGRDAAVRAADPEIPGRLLCRERLEKARIALRDAGRLRTIIVKQLLQNTHRRLRGASSDVVSHYGSS